STSVILSIAFGSGERAAPRPGHLQDRQRLSHLPRSRGSRMSRSASPNMLKPNTAAEIARPGQMESHGDWSMNARPVPLSIEPHVGNGGGTPYPRKLSVDSASTATPSWVVARTRIAAETFGRT